MDQKIRVMLVDDHPLVRVGFLRLLESEPDIEIVAEAETGREAFEFFRQHLPDVVVLNLIIRTAHAPGHSLATSGSTKPHSKPTFHSGATDNEQKRNKTLQSNKLDREIKAVYETVPIMLFIGIRDMHT